VRAYVVTTGVIFGLIVVAHVLRVIEEGSRLAKEPSFVVMTLAAVALCAWAGRLTASFLLNNRRDG
jgi:hypothetical protein